MNSPIMKVEMAQKNLIDKFVGSIVAFDFIAKNHFKKDFSYH